MFLMSANEFVYLFSYFKGHGDGLHLAISEDGFSWRALNNDQPFMTPEVGRERIIRDPFIWPAADGLFHVVWTSDWRGQAIGYTSSPDLLKWADQRLLDVMTHEPEAMNCWAPEIFFDEDNGSYLVYWASSIPGRFPDTDRDGDEGLNHRMYYTTTRDFRTFTRADLFYDPGFNVIDATLARKGRGYILFMKDETRNPCQKNIRFAVSESIFGGFGRVSPPITGSYWAEGPSALEIDGGWIVYFDRYKENRIGAVTSANLEDWTDISDYVHFPRGAQHGSVVRIAYERVRHLF